MQWQCLPLLLAWTVVTSAQQQKTVKWGNFQLTFDVHTGDWLILTWRGQTLAQVPSSGYVASVDIAVGEREERRRWLIERNLKASRLTDWNFDEKTATLILTRQVDVADGRWQLQEIVQFGALGSPNRIARSLRLTWLGLQPVKFYRVRFLLPLPKQGSFLFPTKDPFDPNYSGNLEKQPPGWGTSAAWGVGQLLVQQNANRTLLFINDARLDPATTNFWATNDAAFVANEFVARGWAEPNVTQRIGTAFVEVVPKNLPNTLRCAFWRFYDDAGIKVPSDRPEWVSKAALYSFHPGGTIGSDFKDLGGFEMSRRILLPIIYKLGFSAVWLLPIEDLGVYHPRDYYRFQAGLGTADEYRALVSEAKKLGMKVWQDIVPHGGRPEFGKIRGNKPWWLVFDEDGNALNYWCFDFREPEWQRYIGEVAEHYARNFGIDGFRVDAVSGSRITNWRRKGFPPAEKVPANVPADWWQSELAKVSGQVPPLPYERGSLTLREGGLQMLNVIRQAVRKHNPEGAILGEVSPVPYMQEADVIYDFSLCHSYLPRLRNFSPAEFVWALQRYLEEQRFAEPKGTIRLRYVESHDSLRMQGWVGVNAVRAMMALTFWIDGMPMLYHEAEIGHGVFIQRVLSIRKALPELQIGETFYTDAEHDEPLIKTNPDGIFTCLRTIDFERASISVINFNPQKVEATIHLPLIVGTHKMHKQNRQREGEVPTKPISLHLNKSKRYTLWEAMSGTKIAEGLPNKIATVKLKLQPYQAALLCLRPANEPLDKILPKTGANARSKAPGAQPTIPSPKRLIPETWEIATAHYRLIVDRKTGLLRSFSDAKGKVLISSCDLLMSEKVSIVKVEGERHTEPKTGIVTLPLRIVFSGGNVSLTYRCLPTEVQIEASLQTTAKPSRAGLLFSVANVHRWQINTIEGTLDDWFFARHLSGKRGTHRIYWRPQGTEVVWQSEMTPLHPDDAWLRFWQPDGGTVQFKFDEPLQMGLDNVLLLDKIWDGETPKVGAYVAVMWHDEQSFVPPNNLPRNFVLRLSASLPTSAQSKFPDARSPAPNLKSPIPKLSHTSTDWVIENDHYRILLRRTGGVIRALWAKQPTERLILADSDLYTDRGFRNVQGQVQYAGARDDVETGVRVWRAGGALHLRFFGLLRAGNERFRMLQPPIWFVQEYAFNASPTFSLRVAFKSDGDVQVPPAFLAWTVVVPEGLRFVYMHAGKKLGEWLFNERQRTGETGKLRISPDAVAFIDEVGQVFAHLKDLQFAPSLPQNLFAHGKRFFIAWLDGDEKVAVGKWHECAMQITVGSEQPKPITAKFERLTTKEEIGIIDPSFEEESSEIFSLVQGRWLRFGAPKGVAWNIPIGGSITVEMARTGQRCAKVINTTGDYTLFTQSLSLKQFPPNSKVRLSAWLKGENIKRGDQIWKAASLDLSVQHKDGRWEHKAVVFLDGTFDWRKVEGIVEIPADAIALMVRVGLNGATGVLWIDDVHLEIVQ
ncbi:MAG: alpha-amylase family glycosyl hydrolase [Armatimonadetes bacterium]|nr:alpha-amylase family glycosyl hydrolase [Armatimonadota bacterium]